MFKLHDLTQGHPLLAVTYTILQVSGLLLIHEQIIGTTYCNYGNHSGQSQNNKGNPENQSKLEVNRCCRRKARESMGEPGTRLVLVVLEKRGKREQASQTILFGSRRKAREASESQDFFSQPSKSAGKRERVSLTIGFGLTSDWMTEWHENFKPIT